MTIYARTAAGIRGSSAERISQKESTIRPLQSSACTRQWPIRLTTSMTRRHDEIRLREEIDDHVACETEANARKIGRYIKRYNEDPKPIRWTYSNPAHRITADSAVTVQ